MASIRRWRKAQDYERSYWEAVACRIAAREIGQLDWYSWRATQMENRLAGLIDDDRKKNWRILEVGSGPVGIVSALKWGDRYAIDPLEDFYRANTTLTLHRDPTVRYLQGVGEQPLFENGYFQLVILDNVLDHTQAPERVLRQIHRVLSRAGLLYLAVNVHTARGASLHSVLSKLLIDKGHPYSFTQPSIQNLIRRTGFVIQREWLDHYYEAQNRDRTSASLKDRIKGYTGLSEFIYYSICSKQE